jgi:aconitate hydratase
VSSCAARRRRRPRREIEAEIRSTEPPETPTRSRDSFEEPLPPEKARKVELVKGPNIATLPELDALPDDLEVPVILVADDDISTDEILPAGAEVLPFRSNIPRIAEFAFRDVDPDYVEHAKATKDEGGHAIIGGENYGQGSSREHAALAPRYLGVKAVIVKSFARIHWQNLANFGILALTFKNPEDYDNVAQGDELAFEGLREAIENGNEVKVTNKTKNKSFVCEHQLSKRQIEMVLAGSLLTVVKRKH